jgi:fatty-acyl-CoA synthase
MVRDGRTTGGSMIVQFNVRDFLDRAEVSHPDRVGLIDEPHQPAEPWEPLTFAGLAERARAQAAGLDRLGVAPGQRVAVISHNASRLLTSFFGVCGWGRILVPINFRLAPAEVEYIIGHSGASVVLMDPELTGSLSGIDLSAASTRCFTLGAGTDEDLFGATDEPRPWTADEGATAPINYTSGTTARPVGSMPPSSAGTSR